jgi:gluconolactonase
MHRSISLPFIFALFLSTLSLPAAEPTTSPRIPGVGPTGPIVRLQTGFEFVEGPAINAQGEIFFSDIPAERIYKIGADGTLSTYLEKSHKTNGLFFHANGDLIACEMEGRIVAVREGKAEPLVAEHDGKRFNAPNDLVIDRAGGVYFTDPSFRAPMPLPQGKVAVYYAPHGKDATRIIDELPNPNGVDLSPDEKTLYVIPSGQADMIAYPIQSPGKLGKLGLQVFDATGKLLGVITLPEQPSNAAFGGKDHKTLYVTARKSLYAVPMEIAGHIYPAGKK